MKNKIMQFLLLSLIIFYWYSVSFSDNLDEAKKISEKGDFKGAYEKMLVVAGEMQAEITNQEGLLKYYKDELKKTNSPEEPVDYSYNAAANSLWASAWNYQHDGVFKKTGNEKEEYLNKAVETYRRIVIDYPYSNKAEEAQYRIGRIYYKFMKDYKLANIEIRKYISMHPRGRFTSEAKALLDRIEK